MKKILAFSLIVFLLGGCINEDRSNCSRGLRLQFLYTHNNQNEDLLAEQVGDILVYMFDMTTRLLTYVVRVGPEGIARGYVDVDIPGGLYTMVAWAGSDGDMIQGGYAVNATVGSTTLDDFHMMLVAESLPDNPYAEVKSQNPDFGDLFFALVENVSVTNGWGGRQSVTFAFIKNTSTVRVVVSGLGMLNRSQNLPIDVFTTGQNWRYCYDDAIDGSPARKLYQPYDGSASDDTMTANIRQQRLDISQTDAAPVLLYVRNDELDSDMIAPLNLLSAIRQNPAYQTQQDIDREDLFVIEISILYDLSIRITINEWEIIYLTPDVGKP
jgi:hypothetical protein